jgi:DNA-3-methyladenine glycosylase II
MFLKFCNMLHVKYMHMYRHTLNPVPPFDFNLSTRSFSNGDAQIQKYENGKYWQVIRKNRLLIYIAVSALGTTDNPRLLVELRSPEKLSGSDVEAVLDVVRSIFNLQIDLNSFYEEVQDDEIMSKVVQHLRGLKTVATSTPFEALVSSIIAQQISLSAASRIEQRLVKKLGGVLQVDGNTYYAFPTPENLASVRAAELVKCGLTGRKAEYIYEITRSAADGTLNLEKFRDYDDVNDIINELSKVRGVGEWTARMTALRGLHRLDYYPRGDLGLRRVVSHYYCRGRKVTNDEVRKIAEKWGTLQGLAEFYLMTAEREKVSI